MPHFVPKDEKAARKYVPFWTADGPPDTTEIPTYLFRLTGPSTDGTTTQSFICPPKPQNENLLDLNSCDAAGRLVQHFRWKSEHIAHCNFMSWSSSLLFLLQYAFHRYETQSGDRNFDKIKLLVVDTTAFPKGTFAKDLDLIKNLNTSCGCSRHQDLRNFNDMRNDRHYFGEYITQGALDIFENEGIQVNFQEMRNRKLCQLLPDDLKERKNWRKWASIVVSARAPFRDMESSPALEAEIGAAITIAKDLFKGPWSLPVAAMLLGLKPRQRNDPVIVKGLIKGYGVDVIRESISQRLIIDGARLPEVQQYQYIIDDIITNVPENDEPAPSDTGSSTDDERSSVDNLTSDVASRLRLD